MLNFRIPHHFINITKFWVILKRQHANFYCVRMWHSILKLHTVKVGHCKNPNSVFVVILKNTAPGTPNENDRQTQNDESPSPDSPSSEQSTESPMNGQSSPTIDADLARMEALLDSWCLDLKRNVLVGI